MDMLLPVCMIIVTVAIATIAIMVMRAVRHLETATDEFKKTTEAARLYLTEAERVTREMHDLTLGLQEVLAPLQRSAMRVEELTERATELSYGVLDEVRRPLETAMSLIRGVSAGTRSLVGALSRSRADSNGRDGHE
jgi:uncharacterized protein YoxC